MLPQPADKDTSQSKGYKNLILGGNEKIRRKNPTGST